MLVIFDFQCGKGHIHEVMLDRSLVTNDYKHNCPECNGLSSKIISPVKSILDPISGSYPGATMKWAKDRQAKIKHERKVAAS